MADILGLGWLNTNGTRRYPLSDGGNFDSLGSGAGDIPDDLILDMQISVPYALGVYPFNFYLKAVSGYPHGLIIEIGYHNPKFANELATVAVSEAIAIETHTSPTTYLLIGSPVSTNYDFSNVVGTVTIGNLGGFIATSPGRIDYGYEAYIESSVVSMNTAGVSSIRAGNTLTNSTESLTGHIVLVPKLNFAIETDTTANMITFSSLNGAGLESDCTCEGEIELGPCIQTINNQSPDSVGNIDLIAGPCIAIESGGSHINLSETCSSPCCGCDQLNIIVADLRDLQAGFKKMDSFLNSLAGQVGTITSSAFASVVSNSGCGN